MWSIVASISRSCSSSKINLKENFIQFFFEEIFSSWCNYLIYIYIYIYIYNFLVCAVSHFNSLRNEWFDIFSHYDKEATKMIFFPNKKQLKWFSWKLSKLWFTRSLSVYETFTNLLSLTNERRRNRAWRVGIWPVGV